MNISQGTLLHSARIRCMAVCLALLSTSAAGQPRSVTQDGYVLRASTVQSTAISAAAAKEHGIDPGPRTAVLNVLVEGAGGKNMSADVTARARNLAGMQRDIPMREAKAPNGMLSYVGTFDFASREVVDLEVRAVPRGSSTALQLEFRERMPAVGS